MIADAGDGEAEEEREGGRGTLDHTCTYVQYISSFTFHLGFVHPSLDAALHQCLPLSTFCCFPVLGGSLLPLGMGIFRISSEFRRFDVPLGHSQDSSKFEEKMLVCTCTL